MKRLVSFGLWALALTVPGHAAAQAAEQFDVVCQLSVQNHATYTGGRGRVPNSEFSTSESVRLRVDVAADRFCIGECTIISSGISRTDSTLKFWGKIRDQWPASDPEWSYEAELNRRTGSIVLSGHVRTQAMAAGHDSIWKNGSGQCRREPFSGFPEAMF